MSEMVVIGPRQRRWQAWRDVVLILLGIATVLLVRQVNGLQRELASSTAQHSRQLSALTSQIADLRKQLAVKDARIKQLTDQIVGAGLTPAPAPQIIVRVPRPAPGPNPTLTPSASPRPKASATPRPTPSPVSSCHITASGKCLADQQR